MTDLCGCTWSISVDVTDLCGCTWSISVDVTDLCVRGPLVLL